jgi:hypothetical protein
MATSEERTLEDAIVSAAASLPFITANSVPVRNWDDQDNARALPCVMARVYPRSRVAPNADFYRMQCDVIVARHRGDDPDQATTDQIYNEIADWSYARGSSISFGDDKTLVGVGSGSDAFVRASNGDGQAWTFSARVKPADSGTQTILMAGDYGSGGWVEFDIVNNKFRVRYGDTTGYLQLDAGTVPTGSWSHVLCTFDGGTTGDDVADISDYYSRFSFWVNGVSVSPLESNGNDGYTGSVGSTYFILGGTNTGQYLQEGFVVGDVAVWDSDESANAADIYFGGAAQDLSTLSSAPQHYYRFRDRATPAAISDTMGGKDLVGAGFVAGDYAEGFNTIGFDVDGITYNDGVEDLQDSIHSRGVSFDIYDTIA